MPMIDVVIPAGALSIDAETRLMKEITDVLITAEGFDPKNEIAQAVSVLFLHRPAEVYVAGVKSTTPRYRVTPSVPEGKYSAEAIRGLVKGITEAFARAEGTSFEDIGARLSIFPTEIPEGHWGGRGVIRGVADIQAMIAGESERKIGEDLLARRRRTKALEMIQGVTDSVQRGAGD